MPELPDIAIYVDRIRALFGGQRLQRLRLSSPFVLRLCEPSPDALVGQPLQDVSRSGKRIILRFGRCRFAVLHLMIAGRLHYKPVSQGIPKGSPQDRGGTGEPERFVPRPLAAGAARERIRALTAMLASAQTMRWKSDC